MDGKFIESILEANEDTISELSASSAASKSVPDSAAQSRDDAFATLRQAYKNGELTDDGLRELAKEKGFDADEIFKYLNMSALDREMGVYDGQELPFYKTDLSDVKVQKAGRTVEPGETYSPCDGVKITSKTTGWGLWAKTVYHCESEYLGDFDYDPEEWGVGYKEITEDDGSISKLPVLKYRGDGDKSWGFGDIRVQVPDGVKRLDYSFEGKETLKYVPNIPASVISMHYSFSGCTNMIVLREQYAPEYISLPHNLVDMSGAFKNCSSLEGLFWTGASGKYSLDADYSQIPETVMNITEAWYGCEKMGDVKSNWYGDTSYALPSYGGDKTPYLSEEFAKDALAHISDEYSETYRKQHGYTVKEYADSREYNVDETGKVNPSAQIDGVNASILASVQAASALTETGEIAEGKVETDDELVSNGARTDNWIWDAESDSYINDETGRRKSSNKYTTEWWEKLAIDGTVGLGMFGVTSALTKDILKKVPGGNTIGLVTGAIGAVAGTYALEHFNVLPDSVYPIVKWTANILPEGKWKTKLTEFAESLPAGKVDAYNKEVAEYNKQWDDEDEVASANQELRLTSSFQSVHHTLVQDLSNSMYNNGEACGHKGTLKSAALNGETTTKCVYDVINECTAAMNGQFRDDISAAGGCTDEIKAQMKEYYTKLIDALEGYDMGALDGIKTSYGTHNANFDLSVEGLKMTNRAYMQAAMESLQEMDNEYHFMDENSWKEIQSSNIAGVDIENIQNYDTSYFDVMKTETINRVTELTMEANKFEPEKDTEETTSSQSNSSARNNVDIVNTSDGAETENELD